MRFCVFADLRSCDRPRLLAIGAYYLRTCEGRGGGDSSVPALRASTRNDITREALPGVARMPRRGAPGVARMPGGTVTGCARNDVTGEALPDSCRMPTRP